MPQPGQEGIPEELKKTLIEELGIPTITLEQQMQMMKSKYELVSSAKEK